MTDIKSNSKTGLSAPWYQMQRMVSYSIGQSGQVLVSELDGSYQITVTTIKEATAAALAATLKPKQMFGSITVTLVVKDLAGKTYVPPSSPLNNIELIDTLKTALVNNPLVFGIENFKGNAAICCTPTVIQFWNDNLANPQSFTSMMADAVFKTIFLENIAVYTLGKTIGNF